MTKKVQKRGDPGETDALREMLDAGGVHFTRQRSAVYEYLRCVDHHPTAEEVYLSVKASLPKISLATVYKNLEALVKCGAASRLTFGDAAARYDIRTDRHYHSRCRLCGRISDVEPVRPRALSKLMALPEGFKAEDYRVEVIGVCPNCASVTG